MNRMLLIFALLSLGKTYAQSLYFPPLNDQNTWETISLEQLGWCEEYTDPLRTYLEEKNTKAFIVLKDGKIALEYYFDNFNTGSVWYWASAGKTLTAFTVGIAQESNLLSINEPSSIYLGQGWTSAPPDKEILITIKDQLSMTSGLDDGSGDPFCTIDTCLLYLSDAGTRWAYHNGPYTLLDGVIENATGQNLNIFFAQQVRNKIGMNGAFVKSGFNNVYFSNARSMARFGLLMLNGGNWDGTQVMTDTGYFHEMINSSNSLNPSYGYLWWLNGKDRIMVPGTQFVFNRPLFINAPDDLYAALGLNGQIINVVPSENLIVIRMGESPGPEDIPVNFNDSIWSLLNDIRCTGTYTNESADDRSFELYPNPFSNQLRIKGEARIDLVELYTLSGQLIYTGRSLEDQDFGHLNQGLYLLRLLSGDRSDVIRLFK